MKKIILSLMVAAATFFMTSCDQPDVCINVNVETVPCEFHAKQFMANVDDVIPMRATGKYREIAYQFTQVNGTDVINGTCTEDLPFKVNLMRSGVYKVKLITDSISTSWFDYPEVKISEKNPRVFNHIETFNVDTLLSQKKFTLKHLAGRFVAKVGKIPENHEVVLEVIDFKNGYNWLTEESYSTELLPGDSEETVLTSTGGDIYSRFIVGGSSIKVKVGIRKTGGSTIMKNVEYTYKVEKATIRTITYNINNVDGNGEFIVEVDESLSEVEEENQQIGKPQL